MGIKQSLTRAALSTAMDYISGDPEKNLPKLLGFIESIGWDTNQTKVFHQIIDNPDNVWYRYLMGLWRDIDNDILKAIFRNFGLNATLFGHAEQEKNAQKYGCNIPWAILMDPTSACNLHCTGCWAAEYGHALNLSFEDICSIIDQGRELGCHIYIYTGGEPLVRKDDLIRICEKYPDCVFLCFTNATLIDEAFCQDMIRVANFVPAISAEGNEHTTDARRGDGTYAKIERAMDLLREHELPFGISACWTRANADAIATEKNMDWMIEKGALFCWYFHFMPVGRAASADLMPTPEQRERMYRFVREMRGKKPLFTMDFQNDGEYVGGCIAGGRRYLHINAAGDVEPCVFIHYANANIHEATLLEALKSPIFMAYYEGQPFNDNHLMPCPMLENPDVLPRIVAETGAHSTETPEQLREKTAPAAEAWAPVAERLWDERDSPLYERRHSDPTQGMAETDMARLHRQGRR